MGIQGMFKLSSRQCHCVHRCNTIGLSPFCIAPLSVPKVKFGKGVAVPIVELGEQRVNAHLLSWFKKIKWHSNLYKFRKYMSLQSHCQAVIIPDWNATCNKLRVLIIDLLVPFFDFSIEPLLPRSPTSGSEEAPWSNSRTNMRFLAR